MICINQLLPQRLGSGWWAWMPANHLGVAAKLTERRSASFGISSIACKNPFPIYSDLFSKLINMFGILKHPHPLGWIVLMVPSDFSALPWTPFASGRLRIGHWTRSLGSDPGTSISSGKGVDADTTDTHLGQTWQLSFQASGNKSKEASSEPDGTWWYMSWQWLSTVDALHNCWRKLGIVLCG